MGRKRSGKALQQQASRIVAENIVRAQQTVWDRRKRALFAKYYEVCRHYVIMLENLNEIAITDKLIDTALDAIERGDPRIGSRDGFREEARKQLISSFIGK